MSRKLTVHWDQDAVVSVEVDGARYADPEQIPDPADRARAQRLIEAAAAEADAEEAGDEAGEADFDRAFDQEFEAEVRQLQRDSARFPKIIVGIFLAIAGLTLGIAAVSAFTTGVALSKEVSAPGRVVDLVARRDQAGRIYYYPVVEFRLPDESRQTVQLSEGSSPPSYRSDEAVTVRFDPDQPIRTARIDSVEGAVLLWLLPAITGTVGAAFLAAAVLAARFLRAEPPAAAPA